MDILLHKKVDVIICDILLKDENGIDFLKHIKNKNINTFVCSKKYGNFPCPCVHKLKFLQHVTDNPQSQLDFEILI